jgi:2-polyprenyl-3-methyl-5-hydroxy-6-metoxy-1,4-benzoquinol methylase
MTENCPICNNHIHKIEFSREGYDYKRCRACCTLFVANALTAKSVTEYYDKGYYEAKNASRTRRYGYSSYLATQDSLKASFEYKLGLVRQKINSGKLLDVGAAYGTFLQKAKAHYECCGIEISGYAAKTGQEINQAQMTLGNIEHAPFGNGQFDVITMWDVIEHLLHPIEALSQACRLLKPGGFCFIGTDDVNHRLVKIMGKKWWSLAPPLHLCHFSKNSMETAARRAGGLEICEVIKDRRWYNVGEIIKYFGISYQNNSLTRLGNSIEASQIGRMSVSIKRPEQFIWVLRKYSTLKEPEI